MMDEYRKEIWFKCAEQRIPTRVILNFGTHSVEGICYVTCDGDFIISCRPFGTNYVELWPSPLVKCFDRREEEDKTTYIIYGEKIAIYDFSRVTLIGYGTPSEKMRIVLVSKNNGKPVGEITKRLPFIVDLEEILGDIARRFYVLTEVPYNKILQIFENSCLEVQSPSPIGIIAPKERRPFEFLPNEQEILKGLDSLLKNA